MEILLKIVYTIIAWGILALFIYIMFGISFIQIKLVLNQFGINFGFPAPVKEYCRARLEFIVKFLNKETIDMDDAKEALEYYVGLCCGQEKTHRGSIYKDYENGYDFLFCSIMNRAFIAIREEMLNQQEEDREEEINDVRKRRLKKYEKYKEDLK